MNKFRWCIAIALVMSAMLGACSADAKPQVIAFTWPTTDCDSLPIVASDLIESELIYDIVPMPMPSDTDGPCAVTVDPDPPASATVVPVDTSDTSVILNLHPGQTYYARMRVSAYLAGNWSSWSVQHQFTVPYGKPNRVIIASGLVTRTYNLIEDPVIRLN